MRIENEVRFTNDKNEVPSKSSHSCLGIYSKISGAGFDDRIGAMIAGLSPSQYELCKLGTFKYVYGYKRGGFFKMLLDSGITRSELCKVMESSRQSVSEYVTGYVLPAEAKLAKLKAYLDSRIDLESIIKRYDHFDDCGQKNDKEDAQMSISLEDDEKKKEGNKCYNECSDAVRDYISTMSQMKHITRASFVDQLIIPIMEEDGEYKIIKEYRKIVEQKGVLING